MVLQAVARSSRDRRRAESSASLGCKERLFMPSLASTTATSNARAYQQEDQGQPRPVYEGCPARVVLLPLHDLLPCVKQWEADVYKQRGHRHRRHGGGGRGGRHSLLVGATRRGDAAAKRDNGERGTHEVGRTAHVQAVVVVIRGLRDEDPEEPVGVGGGEREQEEHRRPGAREVVRVVAVHVEEARAASPAYHVSEVCVAASRPSRQRLDCSAAHGVRREHPRLARERAELGVVAAELPLGPEDRVEGHARDLREQQQEGGHGHAEAVEHVAERIVDGQQRRHWGAKHDQDALQATLACALLRVAGLEGRVSARLGLIGHWSTKRCRR
eukprot:scaffold32793_cov69-Phaeocystis_antarctica.AAC.2